MSQQTRSSRNLLIGLIVCGLLLVGIAATLSLRQTLNTPTPTAPAPTSLPGVILLDPPRELVDFTLPASSGQPLNLSDLQGKYTLLFFGYTHCPDFCPLTLTHWKSMKGVLDDAGADLNYLFVSVDGERDTPEVLARYLSRFDTAFVGLTGDADTLEAIGPDYGLDYTLNTDEGENYSVDHTTRTYLLDEQGRMIAVFSFDVPEDVIVQTIQDALPQADL